MDWRPLTLTLLALLLAFASQSVVCALGTPAGTVISTNVTMTCPNGSSGLLSKSSVSTTVAQTAGIVVQTGDAPKSLPAGQTCYVPVTVTNRGNATDAFDLSASSAHNWAGKFVRDDNGDGIHQSTEANVVTVTGSLAADAASKLFLAVTVPAGATTGDAVTVTGVSVFAQAVTANAVVNLPAPATNPPPAFSVPGDFSLDGKVNANDAAIFSRAWLRAHRSGAFFDPALDTPFDLAPRTSGIWPNWTPTGDQDININDATALIECLTQSRSSTLSYGVKASTYRTSSLLIVTIPSAPYRIYQASVVLPTGAAFRPALDSNGNLSRVLRSTNTGNVLYTEYDPSTRTIRLTGNVAGYPPYRVAAIYLGY